MVSPVCIILLQKTVDENDYQPLQLVENMTDEFSWTLPKVIKLENAGGTMVRKKVKNCVTIS